MFPLYSFPASGDFCRLLVTFAKSLDLDQARQNPDDIPENLSKKLILKKHRRQKASKITQHAKS